jgi:hypothetical protein
MRRNGEKGQATLAVLLATSIFLIGAIGLGIDGAHLYAQRQMAQAAADAAAQAGIMTYFDGTNTSTTAPTSSPYTCSGSSDTKTACKYANLNGFATADDTVTIDYGDDTSASKPAGVSLSPKATDPVSWMKVTITRSVHTTLMRLVGAGSLMSVKATGTAAIVTASSSVPIIVTHPTMDSSLSSNGNPTFTICGGPGRSIQVNSTSGTALNMNSNTTVDLSKAGPLDPGDCSTGTGADFGNVGGPTAYPFTFLTGTKPGVYVPSSSPILDPLADVAAPSMPAPHTGPTPFSDPSLSYANGTHGCPASPSKPCYLYYPGLYTSGIDVKNQTGIFSPGIYYITGGGFGASSNGEMYMATSVVADPVTGWTGNMLVYNTGNGSNDIFSVGSNGSASLVGSPSASSYKGILFFEDHTSNAHTGTKSHSLGGGGALSLIGTIYLTNSLSVMQGTPSQYQQLSLQGTPGSATSVQGLIIVSALSLGGNAGITMNLTGQPLPVRQVALVK